MDFSTLEREVEAAVAADEKYQRENDAKFRAIEQNVPSYDHFRDMVKASHLTPLGKGEKIADPNIQHRNVIWNTANTQKSEPNLFSRHAQKKKHFTEQ
ncbi:UNVERIFIED_CONTAM: hypothetical protein PYX00_004360 [Menopon gallinae]|uniref:Dynein attachment factor N-terminal domain-containing protein n=1 Tax=Menopon gallinae TaxID=328185 RepID=A0AAW2I5B8_9NEOP